MTVISTMMHNRPTPRRARRMLVARLVAWARRHVQLRRLAGIREARPGLRGVTLRRDAGMTTAEYAVGTIAACAFAAILYRVVTSDAVTGAMTELVNRALHAV